MKLLATICFCTLLSPRPALAQSAPDSLRAQGKVDEAARVEKRFHQAWEHADVELARSG